MKSWTLFKLLGVAVYLQLWGVGLLASQEAPQTFTFDGRTFSDSAATTPLLDNITLRIQILNQAQDCILYEEQQSVSTTATNGYFTIQVGSVVGAGKRTALDSSHMMSDVYSNTLASISGKLVSNGAGCTYNPANSHVRYVRLLMTPSDLVTRTISPNMALDSVPYASVAERAETLEGLYPANLIQVNTTAPANLTQANIESIFSTTNFPRLTSLLSVAPSNYVQTGSNGSALLPVVAGNPGSGLTSGQIWYDSTANVLKYYDGAVKTVGTSGAATGPIVDNTNSASTAIAVTQSGSGYAGTFMGGNVGIGTATPGYALDVVGDANVSGGYRLGGTQILTVNNANKTLMLGYGASTSAGVGLSSNYSGYNTGKAIAAGGDNDSFFGSEAGQADTTGQRNSFFGAQAGYSTTTGNGNSALGYQALYSNVSNINNTAVGGSAMKLINGGQGNSAVGYNAMGSSTTGNYNVAMGLNAMSNSTGSANIAIGQATLNPGVAFTGSYNTAVGRYAGTNLVSGANNTLIGYLTGGSLTAGESNNTLIGYSADAIAGATNATAIGNGAYAGASNALVLGNSSVNVGIGTTTPAGILDVEGGTSSSGSGTALKLIAQSGAAGNNSGGSVNITAGTSTGAGTSGTINLTGGSSANASTSGASLVVGGGANYGPGGPITLTTSAGTNGYGGGNITIQTGAGAYYGNTLINPTGGSVSIGNNNPQTTLDVTGTGRFSGQVSSGSQTITGGTTAIDWNNGNAISTDYNCASPVTFANLRDGGTYTLIVTDTGTTQCSFSTTTTGIGAGTVSYRFKPLNAARTASTYTVYTFLRVGTVVLVSWTSGF